MIQRNQLRCVSCKTLIVTRFGVGHGSKQVHAFSCPTCAVPITCVMRLDQEKAGIAFDTPVNAEWTTDEAPFPAPVFVTFHPEVLNYKSAFQQDGASPFVTTPFMFTDYKDFRKNESMRLLVRTKFWETIKRVAVHYERQQWDLWNMEVKEVLGEQPELSYEGRLRQMFECYDYSVRHFTLDRTDIWMTARQQYRDAAFSHSKPLTEFIEALRTSGRIASLWRQMNSLHDEFISTYHIWMGVREVPCDGVQLPTKHLSTVHFRYSRKNSDCKSFRWSSYMVEAPGFGLREPRQGQELTGKDVVSIPSILSSGRGQVQNRYSDFRPG